MKLATWNVNSIRARQDRLLAWLQRAQPDVVCLQELKTTEEAFPFAAIEAAGYHAAVYGQKTYNGVAILSRMRPTAIAKGWPDADDDPQARLLRAEIDGVQVISAYVPNGDVVTSEKFAYKLAWLRRMRDYLERHFDSKTPLAVCGDLNVALRESDAARPEAWAGSVLFVPQVRDALMQVMAWGLSDVFAEHHPEGGVYSWWDYRQLAFPKNDGLRIDYILATPALAERCTSITVDRNERKGEKPSDHAPVMAEFR